MGKMGDTDRVQIRVRRRLVGGDSRKWVRLSPSDEIKIKNVTQSVDIEISVRHGERFV